MCYNRCMKNGTRLKNWIGRIDWLLIGTLCVLIMGYVMLHDLCGGTLFRHNDWDSYTLQALAWRGAVAKLQLAGIGSVQRAVLRFLSAFAIGGDATADLYLGRGYAK